MKKNLIILTCIIVIVIIIIIFSNVSKLIGLEKKEEVVIDPYIIHFLNNLKEKQKVSTPITYEVLLETKGLPYADDYDKAKQYAMEDMIEHSKSRGQNTPDFNEEKTMNLLENNTKEYLNGVEMIDEKILKYIIYDNNNFLTFIISNKTNELTQIDGKFDNYDVDFRPINEYDRITFNQLIIKPGSDYKRCSTPLFYYESVLDDMQNLDFQINKDNNFDRIIAKGKPGTNQQNKYYELVYDRESNEISMFTDRYYDVEHDKILNENEIHYKNYIKTEQGYFHPSIIEQKMKKVSKYSKKFETWYIVKYKVTSFDLSHISLDELNFSIPRGTLLKSSLNIQHDPVLPDSCEEEMKIFDLIQKYYKLKPITDDNT